MQDYADEMERAEREAMQDEGNGNGTAATGAEALLLHPTDLGNAKRFALQHGGVVRYCDRLGGWFVSTGQRWQRDEDQAVLRLGGKTIETIWAEISLAVDSAEKAELARHAKRSESAPRIEAMLRLSQAEPGIATAADAFDRDPWLLNCPNGTLDLRSGQLHPHRIEDLITCMTACAYDPAADAPLWDAFLAQILPDAAVRAFLQRAVGYSLTGDVSEQVLFLLYGTGANGKSTFIEILRDMLADYARQAEFSTFLARESDTIRNDLARLRGARFVSAVEAADGRRFSEALVKSLTGGDMIVARFLHREYFEFRPTFKLFLACNHLPRIRATDAAIWRRVRLIPFAVTIPEAERHRTLPERLRRELPGILAWAARGCLDWQANGLQPPEPVLNATENYREEQDQLAGFLKDRCVIEATLSVGATELYAAYQTWCEKNGERPDTQRAFGSRLTERGFSAERSTVTGRIVRHGLALATGGEE